MTPQAKAKLVLIAWSVLIAAPLCVAFTGVKRAPQLIILATFALHAVLYRVWRRGVWVSAALTVALVSCAAAAVTFQLAILGTPPQVAGHPVMPIGHAFGGLLAGVVAAPLAIWLIVRWRRQSSHDTWRPLTLWLDLTGLGLLVAMTIASLR